MYIKSEVTTSSSNLIQIKTGGTQPMTVEPVIVARKESKDAYNKNQIETYYGIGRDNGKK